MFCSIVQPVPSNTLAMFQPSTSRDPFLTRGGESDSDGEGRVGEEASDNDSDVGERAHVTNIREDQSLTPIIKSTVVEGVDANALMLERENQRFTCVEFSPDWSLAVTVTSDGTFSLWETTNEFVLVGSALFQQDQRVLKCIAFDPFNEEAVLLCFDSGEIFRIRHGELKTAFLPSSVRAPGIVHMQLVHRFEGRSERRFNHFTFSSNRKTMVCYNLDGEFAAIQFQEKSLPKSVILSKDFLLKKHPKIYISGQSILVTAIMKSSEDDELSGEQMETLFWPRLVFDHDEIKTSQVRLSGKGYLSNDGKYVLVSMLVTEHQSTCCQIDAYLAKDIKSSMYKEINPFVTRILKSASNHPHVECLDWSVMDFLNAEHGNTKPLIAIQQTDYAGVRLTFWDTNSNALIYEIDLTLIKVHKHFTQFFRAVLVTGSSNVL